LVNSYVLASDKSLKGSYPTFVWKGKYKGAIENPKTLSRESTDDE